MCPTVSLPLLRVFMGNISKSLPDVQIGIRIDILMTSATDVSKGQIYMSYKGELQTHTKQV